MKKYSILLLFISFVSFTFAQNTYVPDNNFEQRLIDLGYDAVLDDYVLTANINTVTYLDVSNRSISDLTGIEAFTDLTDLYCLSNPLITIDVSNNTALETLDCSINQLTSLDVSNNTSLLKLFCGINQLTTLDVSNNTVLVILVCNNNQLTTLEANNGNNTNFSYFDARNNSNLTAIHVDNAIWSTTNWPNKDAAAIYVDATMTYVPDDNFEQALIYFGYDAVLDDYVLTANINTVTYLDVSNRSISDLTGIEAFTALIRLYCHSNQLTNLDVSNNTALDILYFYNNQLTSLDVSNNTALRYLYCFDNQLTNLDVSNNTALTRLFCYNNQLTSLDVSNNTALIILWCYCNQLSSLDVSNNTLLSGVYCYGNQLTSLNAKNGNNTHMTFNSIGNPNLTCIQVDDAAWSTTHWPNIDPIASFSEDCGYNPDADADGIPDVDDDFPNDPDRAFLNQSPAAGYGSLAFEDLWPGKGDYDFNDVVVDYRFATVTNASSYVVDIRATFVAKASGAYFQNGFGFNLPLANSALNNDLTITGNDLQEAYIQVDGNGLEDLQTHPTVIVFDNIFNLLPHPGSGTGVNTEEWTPFVPFDTITIVMTPVQDTYDANDFELLEWNPFIIVNMNRDVEVHLKDHPPTDLADPSIFGTVEDDSDLGTGRYYVTVNNLPWAIDVPSSFDWPKEKVDISWAYLNFRRWAETSGGEYHDWYLDTQGYRNNSNIYPVP